MNSKMTNPAQGLLSDSDRQVSDISDFWKKELGLLPYMPTDNVQEVDLPEELDHSIRLLYLQILGSWSHRELNGQQLGETSWQHLLEGNNWVHQPLNMLVVMLI